MKSPAQNEPFWMDDPTPVPRPLPSETQGNLVRWIVRLTMAQVALTALLILAGLLVLAIKYPLAWIFLVPGILVVAVQFILPRFIETRHAKAIRIQRRALEQLGAALVGSAIHTAGHPSLLVDAPVVLALKNAELSIYGYDSPSPLDTLPVHDLQRIDLITFDDDNVPHTGVIDASARALQITFERQGISCTCSFRRMYNVRPIEWYQAIQKARVEGMG